MKKIWSPEATKYLCDHYSNITTQQMRGRLYFLHGMLYSIEAIYSKAQSVGLAKDGS